MDIYNTFCKALDDGKEVRAVFFYVSKAFDKVWHEGLLLKLRTVCISGALLQLWFIYYLSNRKQQVILPGVSSELSTLKAGVSQGSILGPLLFVLYINDIVENIDCSTRLFADDTSLYIIVDDPLDTAQFSILIFPKYIRGPQTIFVTFNPSKSESLLFSSKLYRPYHPPVCINNQPVAEMTSNKHLGLVFCSDCTLHDILNI